MFFNFTYNIVNCIHPFLLFYFIYLYILSTKSFSAIDETSNHQSSLTEQWVISGNNFTSETQVLEFIFYKKENSLSECI